MCASKMKSEDLPRGIWKHVLVVEFDRRLSLLPVVKKNVEHLMEHVFKKTPCCSGFREFTIYTHMQSGLSVGP